MIKMINILFALINQNKNSLFKTKDIPVINNLSRFIIFMNLTSNEIDLYKIFVLPVNANYKLSQSFCQYKSTIFLNLVKDN